MVEMTKPQPSCPVVPVGCHHQEATLHRVRLKILWTIATVTGSALADYITAILETRLATLKIHLWTGEAVKLLVRLVALRRR
jgi:hypothetical protein